MLDGVKLNREELLITKKGLIVFTFYMVKKFEKILKWKYLSVKTGRGGGYTSRHILLKNLKVNF